MSLSSACCLVWTWVHSTGSHSLLSSYISGCINSQATQTLKSSSECWGKQPKLSVLQRFCFSLNGRYLFVPKKLQAKWLLAVTAVSFSILQRTLFQHILFIVFHWGCCKLLLCQTSLNTSDQRKRSFSMHTSFGHLTYLTATSLKLLCLVASVSLHIVTCLHNL